MLRILLADHRPIFCAGLQSWLARQPDLTLLTEVVTHGDRLVRRCRQWTPDIVLVNVQSPGLAWPTALRELAAAAPQTQRWWLLEASDGDAIDLQGLLQTGWGSAILSDEPLDVWLSALHSVSQGELWYSPRLLMRIIKAQRKAAEPQPTLTARELEVLHYVANGLSNKEIAHHLQLSTRTVVFHLSNILHELQVSTRLEAALWFKEQHFPADPTQSDLPEK